MTRAGAIAALAASLATLPFSPRAFAKPPAAARWRPPARPAAPLSSLPTLSRIVIEAARDRVVLIEDVTLPRGDWEKGDLDLYVAFGAPGAPKAFDARLVPLADAEHDAPLDAPGEPVLTELAPHRPVSANALLGPSAMAGEILHVKEASYARALGASDVAVVRIRQLFDLPAEDAQTGRQLVVRLGAPSALPITLGKIAIVSLEPRPFVTRAEARLCGAEADGWPLAASISPAPPAEARPRDPRGAISPRMALRHATDDLCVRFWTAS